MAANRALTWCKECSAPLLPRERKRVYIRSRNCTFWPSKARIVGLKSPPRKDESMYMKEFSARVVTFKLAAALEIYEIDLRALAQPWLDREAFRRVQQEFSELRILGASLPRLSVAWVAVLVSRARLLQALCGRSGPALAALQDHLADVEGLRRRCLRLIGAQGVVPA